MIHSILTKTMMTSQEDNIKDKYFLIKVYDNLLEINRAIQTIVQNINADFQLSILGKLSSNDAPHETRLDEVVKEIRIQLSRSLGKHIQLDHIRNPEIGLLIIAGHLTSTFQQKVDQKELASLHIGLLGIFRGIGIELNHIDRYIQELKNERFLLIIRGENESLKAIENML